MNGIKSPLKIITIGIRTTNNENDETECVRYDIPKEDFTEKQLEQIREFAIKYQGTLFGVTGTKVETINNIINVFRYPAIVISEKEYYQCIYQFYEDVVKL